eukprot:4249559-Pyramimonas_sp.AAC.1
MGTTRRGATCAPTARQHCHPRRRRGGWNLSRAMMPTGRPAKWRHAPRDPLGQAAGRFRREAGAP